MVSRVVRSPGGPAFIVPDRIPSVPRLERDDAALNALQVGSDSGTSPFGAQAFEPYEGAFWPGSAAPLASAPAQATPFLSDAQFQPATIGSDGSFMRMVPNATASGSFLSNGGRDPLGVSDPLEMQASAMNNSESVTLASNRLAMDKQTAMAMINNIK